MQAVCGAIVKSHQYFAVLIDIDMCPLAVQTYNKYFISVQVFLASLEL
jgi:hypothetical protein